MQRPDAPAAIALGDCVVLTAPHSHAGTHGTVQGSPGRAFNGWTVRLDSGSYVGASIRQMRKETT